MTQCVAGQFCYRDHQVHGPVGRQPSAASLRSREPPDGGLITAECQGDRVGRRIAQSLGERDRDRCIASRGAAATTLTMAEHDRVRLLGGNEQVGV